MKRPRKPIKCKKESWDEYVARFDEWYEAHGRFIIYGIACGEAGWEKVRKRVADSVSCHIEQTRELNEKQGLMMPFDSPFFSCNKAALKLIANWDEHCATNVLVSEKRNCPMLDIPCKHPERPLTDKVGYLDLHVLENGRQQHLFPEMIPQHHKHQAKMCCVEGLYRLASRRRRDGWTVKVHLGEGEMIEKEYEILFGQRPCYE